MYFRKWHKGRPAVPRSAAVSLAKRYGVSRKGSTATTMQRVGRAAERERDDYSDPDRDMLFNGGWFCGSEDEDEIMF